MTTAFRFTSKDLECFPDIEGVRYEIIDGELYVSTAPNWQHQYACGTIVAALGAWNRRTGIGESVHAPGVIFAPDQEVIPDAVWISRERLASGLDDDGHLRVAPELVVEVLSPGTVNELRDREIKLSLYSRQRVEEYWIVDWRGRAAEVFRQQDGALRHVASLRDGETLTTPLLPGFACPVSSLWTSPI
jgi:Uma2 family endonuclease